MTASYETKTLIAPQRLGDRDNYLHRFLYFTGMASTSLRKIFLSSKTGQGWYVSFNSVLLMVTDKNFCVMGIFNFLFP